jgi:TPR repeat protein
MGFSHANKIEVFMIEQVCYNNSCNHGVGEDNLNDLEGIFSSAKEMLKVGIPEEEENAIKLFVQLSEKGHIGAIDALIEHYNYETSKLKNTINVDEALKCCKAAAEGGCVIAQRCLGNFIAMRCCLILDRDKAFHCLNLAASQGNVSAQYSLSTYYFKAWGTPQNEEQGLKLVISAAERGHASAQSALAHYYRQGKVLPLNQIKAFELDLLAAEQGSRHAQNAIAMCYMDGIGVDCDVGKAAKYYMLAAKQDYVYSKGEIEQILTLSIDEEGGWT